MTTPSNGSRARAVTVALFTLVEIGVSGCGSHVQRAAIVPAHAPAAEPSTKTKAIGPAVAAENGAPTVTQARPLELRLTAKRYVIDPARSRFEIFGRDLLTGEHKMTFGSWQAHVEISASPTIHAHVDTASVVVDMAGATSIVKRRLLETDRFPSATLSGTLSRTDGPAEEHVVEGTADLHGVKKGLRFVGLLRPEGDGYRFTTNFVISRKEFEIRYAPIEPFLRDDVRIVIDVFAKPVAAADEPPLEPSGREPVRPEPAGAEPSGAEPAGAP